MSESQERKAYPNTYVVQDRSSNDELLRLKVQDEMVTEGMGGVLPEHPDPASIRSVLDVGCGAGGWLIKLAQAYPEMQILAGIDVSKRMIDYAQERAQVAGVADRVEFRVMDATLVIEFPRSYFDLVNQRLGFSYLRTWDWTNLLRSYQAVTRLGGTVRITESDAVPESSSPALNQFYDFLVSAYYASGHLFTQNRRSVIQELPRMMQQMGFGNVQARPIQFGYKAGDEKIAGFYDDMTLVVRTVAPFVRKWTRAEDYDQICKRALEEMRQPDFTVSWQMLTVWGTRERASE